MGTSTVAVRARPSTIDTDVNAAIRIIEDEGRTVTDVHPPVVFLDDSGHSRLLVLIVYRHPERIAR